MTYIYKYSRQNSSEQTSSLDRKNGNLIGLVLYLCIEIILFGSSSQEENLTSPSPRPRKNLRLNIPVQNFEEVPTSAPQRFDLDFERGATTARPSVNRLIISKHYKLIYVFIVISFKRY